MLLRYKLVDIVFTRLARNIGHEQVLPASLIAICLRLALCVGLRKTISYFILPRKQINRLPQLTIQEAVKKEILSLQSVIVVMKWLYMSLLIVSIAAAEIGPITDPEYALFRPVSSSIQIREMPLQIRTNGEAAKRIDIDYWYMHMNSCILLIVYIPTRGNSNISTERSYAAVYSLSLSLSLSLSCRRDISSS